MLKAGDLNRRIEVQYLTRVDDGAGGSLSTWDTFMMLWADVQPLSSKEVLSLGQIQATTTHKVIMRYRTDILTSHRILYGTKILEITSIIDVDDRHEALELICREGKASHA